MRTITQTFNVYTFDTHPHPENVVEWVSSNWHDLADHCLDEMAASLEGFAEAAGLTVDYSLSAAPDRSEHVTFRSKCGIGYFEGLSPAPWIGRLDFGGNCPFTGMVYDEVILDACRDWAARPLADMADLLNDIQFRVLKALHDEHDYLYSEEAIREMCEANEYEFHEDGSFYL